jgi:transposase
MFLRSVKARSGSQVHEYLRLVEAYWEDGRSKQRVVATLGRTDLLAPHVDRLVQLLGGAAPPPTTAGGDAPAAVAPTQAACWGPFLVARTLWQRLGAEAILDGCAPSPGRGGGRPRGADRAPLPEQASLADRALVLVANRLSAPRSEHGLAGWLESDWACDRQGRRFSPQWARRGRVQVDLSWLQQWYRTLDQLLAHKARIEQELFLRLRDLFSLRPELVFYDLTSTYFEGAGPAGLAQHGYSRDGKPRKRQVLVGVVLVNGWPLAHHVFRGNLRDAQTVQQVVADLEQRFGLRRVVFVGDRGMMTTDNVARLKAHGQGYLLGVQRRRREAVYRLIERAQEDAWLPCPVGITAGERTPPPRTEVQEVASDEPGVRCFVVRSEDRLGYERGLREQAMTRTRAALERLAARVAKGQLKAPEKIGAAASRILGRHHGHRYYGWALEAGAFRFFEHPVHLRREEAYEGTYLIETEEAGLGPVEAVQAYKQLAEVERAFRCLKDVLELRPIYHRRQERVEAHIFVAALAFLLQTALEKALKAASVPLSAAQALEALRTVHVVDVQVGESSTRGVTVGSGRARQVLAALGINDRSPPGILETTQKPT